MNENQWLTCTDAEEMLEHLHGTLTPRKRRLFACALCRRIWHLLKEQRSRDAVIASEKYADRLIRRVELIASRKEAMLGQRSFDYYVYPAQNAAASVACPTIRMTWIFWLTEAALGNQAVKERGGATAEINLPLREEVRNTERAARVVLLRDIVGNPFQRYRIKPAWFTWNNGTIDKLARAAYQEQILPEGTLDPAHIGVLADALEDAGCTETAILSHLREPGPHVRGCWLVDLLLGKR